MTIKNTVYTLFIIVSDNPRYTDPANESADNKTDPPVALEAEKTATSPDDSFSFVFFFSRLFFLCYAACMWCSHFCFLTDVVLKAMNFPSFPVVFSERVCARISTVMKLEKMFFLLCLGGSFMLKLFLACIVWIRTGDRETAIQRSKKIDPHWAQTKRRIYRTVALVVCADLAIEFFLFLFCGRGKAISVLETLTVLTGIPIRKYMVVIYFCYSREYSLRFILALSNENAPLHPKIVSAIHLFLVEYLLDDDIDHYF